MISYVIQIYLDAENIPDHRVEIWIENSEVLLVRGGKSKMGSDLKAHLVLDYNLWRLMNMVPEKFKWI